MKILRKITKHAGRYLIYLYLGYTIPYVAHSITEDAPDWVYWVVLGITSIAIVGYMLVRDYRYYNDEWDVE